MKIGLGLPQLGQFADVNALVEVAVTAEAAGFSSLWTVDRQMAPVVPRTPYPASPDGALPSEQSVVLDPLLALATAAAHTRRIALGTSVLVAPFYAPLMLARSAASLDRLTGGRFVLGLGVGWSADEYAAIGVAQRRLGARLDEVLDVLAAAWREDIVSVTTSREVIAPSVIGLKPAGGRVPLVLAAYSPAGLDRIARRADGWTPAGVPVAAAVPMWHSVLRAAAAYGRDPSSLQLVVRANVKLTALPLGAGRAEFTGSPVEVRDDVLRAREAGVDEIIIDLQGTAHSVDHLLEATAFLASMPVDASSPLTFAGDDDVDVDVAVPVGV